MKKFLALLLAMAMVLSLLAGCTSTSKKKKSSSSSKKKSESTSETGSTDGTGSTDNTGSTDSAGKADKKPDKELADNNNNADSNSSIGNIGNIGSNDNNDNDSSIGGNGGNGNISSNGGNGGNSTIGSGDISVKPANSMVGTWSAQMDLAAVLEASGELDEITGQNQDMAAILIPKDITSTVHFIFDASGKVTMRMDLTTAMETWKSQMERNMLAYLRNLIQQNGMTETAFEQQIGSTLEEYVKKEFTDNLDLDALDLKNEVKGTYSIEGNKVYIDNERDTYLNVNFNNDTFTIVITNASDASEFAFFTDLTFVKQA